MGGVNAAGTLAALPLAFLVAASRLRQRGRAALLGWWAPAGPRSPARGGSVPLLLLGRYSPPFLDYIETAAATTYPTGWANSLRGAEHWVAYTRSAVRPGGPAPTAGDVGARSPSSPWRSRRSGSSACCTRACRSGCRSRSRPGAGPALPDGGQPVAGRLPRGRAGARAARRSARARCATCTRSTRWSGCPLALGVAHAVRAARRAERPRCWSGAAATRHLPVARRVVGGVLASVLLVGAAPLLLRTGCACPGGPTSPRPGRRPPTTSTTSRAAGRWSCPAPASACRPGAGRSTSRSRGWPRRRG